MSGVSSTDNFYDGASRYRDFELTINFQYLISAYSSRSEFFTSLLDAMFARVFKS